jgi:hypothetical protein
VGADGCVRYPVGPHLLTAIDRHIRTYRLAGWAGGKGDKHAVA